MKIVFVCGALEPGKDGVGDYIRRLATELIHLGHDIAIMSINDKYVALPDCSFQESGDTAIYSVRLPGGLSKQEVVHYTKKWLGDFDPDWVSLQFVPFAFHNKGLAINLDTLLKTLFAKSQWHIMFHELWVGMQNDSTVKLKLWGQVQKVLIKRLINKLKPTVIHTQTHLYQAQLQSIKVNAEFLPLFSNIPVLQKKEHANNLNSLVFVLFGGIHQNAKIRELAQEAAGYAKQKNKDVKLIIIGKSGSGYKDWVKEWEEAGIGVEVLGEQPKEKISEVLNSCTIGISTTPYQLAEKSGTIAAMLAHGIPVICVRNTWNTRQASQSPQISGLYNYQKGHLDSYLSNSNTKFKMDNHVSKVAYKLQQSLLKQS